MKKVLSILLAVVLLFGAVPFSTSIKSALGVSQASAMETVAGSYDYAVNFIKTHGEKDSDGENRICNTYIYEGFNIYVSMGYNPKSDFFFACGIFQQISTKVIGSMIIEITKEEKSYQSVVVSTSKFGEEEASTVINPSTYRSGQKYAYNYSKHLWETSEDKLVSDSLFNVTIDMGIICIDDFFAETLGFGLGNFGFTNVSNPAPIPEMTSTVSFWDSIVNFFKMIIDFFRNLFSAVITA